MKPALLLASLAGAAVLADLAVAQAPSQDPATELASFKVLEGFDVSLFASEREGVVKPIQIRFDPDGRLWVAQSTAYPQVVPGVEPDDKILVLEDTSGAGRADKVTVFADHLLIPTGLELGDGGAYVGAGGELLHLRDTDGDGRADERRVVLRGFGTGDAHQTINSFSWGPSGELMLSQGLHADSRLETPWGVEELKQAGVMRFWPRALRVDAFWTGAMGPHNPFGTVFDRWGQPVVFAGNGHGVYHLTQAMIRTDHFLEQGWLWNQGRKFAGGDIVENSRWPADRQGEFITGGYLQNTVERFRITDAGATFRVDRLPPLVESTDTAFRIVDVSFGPDGALYLADWYNPIIGHYQASFRHPDRDKAHGRIWRVTPHGAAPIAWKKLGALSAAELAPLLASPERWTRQMAKRVLADKPAPEVAQALNAWTRDPSLDDHALFEALGVYASQALVETNLLARVARARSPEARAYAARVIGHWGAVLASPLEWLAPLAADASPRVRLEAVVACSYAPDARAVEVAARAMDAGGEPAIEYAFIQCVHALEPLWRDRFAQGGLTFEGVAARQNAFARALGGGDAARLAAGRLRRIGEVALDAPAIAQLTDLVASAGGPEDLTLLLNPASFRIGGHVETELQARALITAAEAARHRDIRPKDPAAALTALIENGTPAVRAAAWRLVGAWKVASLRPRIEKLAMDAGGSAELRSAAFLGLAGFGDEKAIETLTGVARQGAPLEARTDAALALAPLAPRPAALAVSEYFEELSPERARAFASALLRVADGTAALRAAVRENPPKPPGARQLLASLAGAGRSDAYLEASLRKILGAGATPAGLSLENIPALAMEVRTAGDPARGRAVFLRPETACSACHSVDGTPGKIGPDLSSLGTAQTLDYILGAIIAPQKEVKEGFMAIAITDKGGELYQGYLRGETQDSISLFDHLSARNVTLRKDQVAERRQIGSLMPTGLANTLSRGDFLDLVSYLSRLGRH